MFSFPTEKSLKDNNMEASMYKELSYRVRGFRVVTAIVATVTIVLCLLIGIGTWILVSGVRENERFLNNVREHDITIIEGEIKEPLNMGEKPSTNGIDKVVQHIAQIDFKEADPMTVDHADLVATDRQNNYPELPRELELPEKTYSSNIFSQRSGEVKQQLENADSVESKNVPHVISENRQRNMPLIDKFISFTNNLRSQVIETPNFVNNNFDQLESTFRTLGNYANQVFGYEEQATHRSERSVGPMMIGNALKYASYAAFAKFMYNEASAITEYKIESRKLHGDPEANFLDNIFWSKPTIANKPSRIDVVDPNLSTEVVAQEQPLTYGSDNWEPMVNQVSLGFMSELLNTLLKIMREFLLRDHVMECLWFMFCQDVNHQAKYSDVYGVMARINSVGLKVLTDREDRETDTIGDIWRAISAFSPLQCDVMFPKCDGSKALEIVNDVASGSE